MADEIHVDAIILASGMSKRMGCNKLLLPFLGSPLVERALEQFPYDLFGRVLMVAADPEVISIAAKFPVTICKNDGRSKGKSEAIKCGLNSSSARDGYLFAVADQPLLRGATVTTLLERFISFPGRIVLPFAAGKSKNPVIFPALLRNELLALAGDCGGKEVIKKHPQLIEYVEFSSAEEFQDVDTQKAYKTLVKQWQNRS